MSYEEHLARRSRTSRRSVSHAIAADVVYSAHNSCAVKAHAYGLDISTIGASALQQNLLFPQLLGIALFLRIRHGKGCAPQGAEPLPST